MNITHKKHKKKFKLRPVSNDSYSNNIGIPLMIVFSLIALLFGLAVSILFKYCIN